MPRDWPCRTDGVTHEVVVEVLDPLSVLVHRIAEQEGVQRETTPLLELVDQGRDSIHRLPADLIALEMIDPDGARCEEILGRHAQLPRSPHGQPGLPELVGHDHFRVVRVAVQDGSCRRGG